MPKSIEVVPERLSRTGKLQFADVPLYQYNATIAAEQETRGTGTLINVLRHMMIVREFETMLNAVRSTGEYAGCLLYTSPSPRDGLLSRMPSSA